MARGQTVYRGIQGQIRRETEKAILIAITRIPEQPVDLIWIPISQCSSIHRAAKDSGKLDTLMVSEWILGEKGLLSISHSKNPALESAASAPDLPLAPEDKPDGTYYGLSDEDLENDIPF